MISVGALLAGVSLSCGGGGGGGGVAGPSDDADLVEVLLTDGLRFQPANITISPGTTVRWRSVSAVAHTVTPTNHQEFSSATLVTAGQSFTHTFSTTGTFPYVCEFHPPGMTGTIVVQAEAGVDAPGNGNEADPGDPNYPGF